MKVLLADHLDPGTEATLRRKHDVVDVIGASPEVTLAAVADREVIVLRSGIKVTADLLAAAPKLRLLVRAGVGTDNIDLGYMRQAGVHLVRVPGPAPQAVAELTIGLLFALKRRIVEADRMLQWGHWAKHSLMGTQVAGKSLGIVGTGRIGTRVGELAHALGMHVVGCVERPTNLVAAELRDKGIVLATFERALESEVVSLHVPLTERTRGLIDSDALARMPEGSFLLNLSRGGVVVERDVLTALRSGHLAGAAFDVHEREGDRFRSPLTRLPNVVLTPHIGSMAAETQHEIGRQILRTLEIWETSPVLRRGRPELVLVAARNGNDHNGGVR